MSNKSDTPFSDSMSITDQVMRILEGAAAGKGSEEWNTARRILRDMAVGEPLTLERLHEWVVACEAALRITNTLH